MNTNQQHIDQLIATIWHATENRSVTNVMVARVLDWLNRRHADLLQQMQTCCAEKREDLRILDNRITLLAEQLKGVKTVADNAFDRSADNATRIALLGRWVNAILKYLTTGEWDTDLPEIYTMEIDLGGDYFLARGETKHVSCRVLRGWEDVTDSVETWTIRRDTGEATDDAAWALKPKVRDFAGQIDICLTKTENDIGARERAVFTVTAILKEGASLQSLLEF